MATTRCLGSEMHINNASPWITNTSLKKLCQLLKNEGDRVLNGNSAFTLTTDVLAQINVDCRRHSVIENDVDADASDLPRGSRRSFIPQIQRFKTDQEDMKAKAEWSTHIQFIKDFMLSTPNLKIIHNSGTISSPISLFRFGNLTCLHLRRIPLHMVEGLHQLRNTLTSLTLYRSVDKLKDLLESCGGDMCASMTWPRLKFVSLMFNELSSLDDSLRLLPSLELLDLSHNRLQTSDLFLEYLGDVRCLTVAYNFLTHLPPMSLEVRSSLTVLLLRGNNLDSIQGIDELLAIQELDLGENCLNDHSFLNPLSALLKLEQLQLDGNPIFYHRLHRPLAVLSLAKQVVNVQFELDRKKLTLSEIAHFSANYIQYQQSPGLRSPSSGLALKHKPALVDCDYDLAPASTFSTRNESDGIASPKSIRKSRRKKLKAKYTEIADMDFTQGGSSSHDATPGTSPAPRSFDVQMKVRMEEARKTKTEIEALRHQLGPNWLQAIEESDVFNKKRKKQIVAEQLLPDCGANSASKQGVADHFNIDFKGSSESDSKPEKSETDERGNADFPTKPDLYHDESTNARMTRRASVQSKVQEITVQDAVGMSAACQQTMTTGGVSDYEHQDRKGSARLIQDSCTFQPAETLSVEEDEVIEAVFVSLPKQDHQMIILTLTSSYLVEKDIGGKVTEKLELSSLKAMDWKLTAMDSQQLTQGSGDVMQLTLKFDYVRRDRQSRCYVLDTADGKVIRDFLQPMLKSKVEERNKSEAVMQCLKCNETYLRSEVMCQKKPWPASGSSKDVQHLNEPAALPLCLKCGSTIMIQLETSHSPGSMEPMNKRKSLDHTSSLQTLQMSRRKSIDSATSRTEFVAGSVAGTDGSWSKEGASMRERSKAFAAASTFVPTASRRLAEADELICVEDHFAKEIMTSILSRPRPLAEMTTNLQGDSSAREAKALVKDREVKLVSEKARLQQSELVSSGSVPISIACGSFRRGNYSQSEDHYLHRHLAAMEDLVSALVSEGEKTTDTCSNSKGHCVSSSTFKNLSSSDSHAQGTERTGLRCSESSSSITVLPAPLASSHSDSVAAVASVPVRFAVGSPAIISPLNSNICSSMVSSVYEMSVSLPETGTQLEDESKATDVVDGDAAIESVPVLIVDSEEDLISIYDEARKTKYKSDFKSKRASSGDKTVAVEVEEDNDGAGHELLVQVASPAGQCKMEDSEDENEAPCYAFHQLNHSLTLYMMMSLFGTEEEFFCKIQGEIVQYIIEEPYQGLLVMSSTRFYILKFTSKVQDYSLPPEQWLHCVEIQPIPELRFVDVGLGGQSLRLEFVTDCSSYTLITRNRDKTAQFMEVLHNKLAMYAVSQGIASHVVVHEDVEETTLHNLDLDVVSKIKPGQKLLLYCMGYIERGSQKLFPVSFVLTTSDICLVRTNHQWPQPYLQAPLTLESVGKQFTVLERQKINNIAMVEVCEVTLKKVRVELFSETDGITTSWNITMAARQSTMDFISALSEPWAKEFGVEMDVIYSELTF